MPHLAQQVLEGIRMVVHIIIHHVGQTHGLCCCWCKLTRIHRWSLGISSNGVLRDGEHLTWLEQDRTGRTTHRGEGVVRGAGGNGEHSGSPHLQPLLAYMGESKCCYHGHFVRER